MLSWPECRILCCLWRICCPPALAEMVGKRLGAGLMAIAKAWRGGGFGGDEILVSRCRSGASARRARDPCRPASPGVAAAGILGCGLLPQPSSSLIGGRGFDRRALVVGADLAGGEQREQQVRTRGRRLLPRPCAAEPRDSLRSSATPDSDGASGGLRRPKNFDDRRAQGDAPTMYGRRSSSPDRGRWRGRALRRWAGHHDKRSRQVFIDASREDAPARQSIRRVLLDQADAEMMENFQQRRRHRYCEDRQGEDR